MSAHIRPHTGRNTPPGRDATLTRQPAGSPSPPRDFPRLLPLTGGPPGPAQRDSEPRPAPPAFINKALSAGGHAPLHAGGRDRAGGRCVLTGLCTVCGPTLLRCPWVRAEASTQSNKCVSVWEPGGPGHFELVLVEGAAWVPAETTARCQDSRTHLVVETSVCEPQGRGPGRWLSGKVTRLSLVRLRVCCEDARSLSESTVVTTATSRDSDQHRS